MDVCGMYIMKLSFGGLRFEIILTIKFKHNYSEKLVETRLGQILWSKDSLGQ